MLNLYALERRIEEHMRAGHVPGLALAIILDGQVSYARGFGVTSVEDGGLPVTPETLFRIGSITKSMTATMIMRLVEAGRLDLDRPVAEYVPWLAFSQAGLAKRITLRLLLSHSAGLPTSHTPFGRRDASGLEEYVRDDVPHYQFIAPPGKLYAYSNPGIRISGYIAEAVTGRPYTTLMQELVFDPLEMRRTTFDPAVAMTYPLAQSHDLDEDGNLTVQHRYADDSGGYPSGSVISTVMDLAHFAIMQMSAGLYGDQRVLAPESVAEMQKTQVDRYTTTGGGYGLALWMDEVNGIRRVGHEGSISTFGSHLLMAPEAGAAVILFFNRAPGFWDRSAEIVNSVLGQLLDRSLAAPGPRSIAPERSLWSRYAGSYLGDWRGLAVVNVVDEQLILEWNGRMLPLEADRNGLYFFHDPDSGETIPIGFIPEGDLPVQYIQIDSSPCRRYTPGHSLAPAPDTWPTYAGNYVGVENVVVRRREDQLMAYFEDLDQELACVPLGDHTFACDAGLLAFHIAADGAVPSLKLGNVYTLKHKAGV
jgi:CubicO group peptidase (beta-lactamase class C family)